MLQYYLWKEAIVPGTEMEKNQQNYFLNIFIPVLQTKDSER